MDIQEGFSKNGVQLKANSWYLAKRDSDSDLFPWHCQMAFRSDDKPKLLRHPSSLSWDVENKKLIRHSPSPYDFDYNFYVEKELTELEVAKMYGMNIETE
jgi:hypothetical protein